MSKQDKDIGKKLCELSVKRWEAGMSEKMEQGR